jgi:hypothetical protein
LNEVEQADFSARSTLTVTSWQCGSLSHQKNEISEMMMKILVMLACLFFTSGVFADCVTNARGKTVCSNGQGEAASYNPNTGKAVKSETNQNGMTTTQTSKGGEATTKNGKGVYKAPNGTTCVKTRNNQGCK